jgi:hypothetical protein
MQNGPLIAGLVTRDFARAGTRAVRKSSFCGLV